jgi:hypothetical protein
MFPAYQFRQFVMSSNLGMGAHLGDPLPGDFVAIADG